MKNGRRVAFEPVVYFSFAAGGGISYTRVSPLWLLSLLVSAHRAGGRAIHPDCGRMTLLAPLK